MEQFDSKHQRPALPARAAAPHSPLNERVEPLLSKTAKLSLNNPPVISPEKAMDPIVLGKGTAAKQPATAPDKASQQLAVDHEFIDTVTLAVRAVLSGHPVAAKPQESARLAEDKVKVDASKTQRKNTEQNLRVQQNVETERAQQKTISQHKSSGHGAEHQSREQGDPKAAKPATEVKATALAKEVPVQRTLEDQKLAEAIRTRELADRNNAGQQSALAERNSSRQGERATISQDLVRDRSEQPRTPATEKETHRNLEARNSEETRVSEQKRELPQASESRLLEETRLEKIRLGTDERLAYPRPEIPVERVTAQVSSPVDVDSWQSISLEKPHHHRTKSEIEPTRQQLTPQQLQQAEEEEERKEKERALRRARIRANTKLRAAQKAKRSKKKLSPAERRKEKLRLDRNRRLRRRRRPWQIPAED